MGGDHSRDDSAPLHRTTSTPSWHKSVGQSSTAVLSSSPVLVLPSLVVSHHFLLSSFPPVLSCGGGAGRGVVGFQEEKDSPDKAQEKTRRNSPANAKAKRKRRTSPPPSPSPSSSQPSSVPPQVPFSERGGRMVPTPTAPALVLSPALPPLPSSPVFSAAEDGGDSEMEEVRETEGVLLKEGLCKERYMVGLSEVFAMDEEGGSTASVSPPLLSSTSSPLLSKAVVLLSFSDQMEENRLSLSLPLLGAKVRGPPLLANASNALHSLPLHSDMEGAIWRVSFACVTECRW